MSFNLDQFWVDQTAEHMETARKTFMALPDVFGQWLDVCTAAVQNGNKIMFMGNGGSAADAQHLAAELSVRFKKDRPAIASLALHTDTSALTACGNDLGFDQIFARQIEALGKEGDVAIGISTSGNSDNILLAMKQARQMGLITVGLSGRDGGQMHDVCDIVIVVPSDITANIQEMHITLGHMLCGALELNLGLVEDE